jgi:hypothetical protein
VDGQHRWRGRRVARQERASCEQIAAAEPRQHRHHTSHFTIMLFYTSAQYYCACFCERVNHLSIRHLSAFVIFFNDVLFVKFHSSMCVFLITHRIRPQVRTVKMLAQAVCGMTVCQNGAAGVNCMWAASYDGELSSWVIDDLCVLPPPPPMPKLW